MASTNKGQFRIRRMTDADLAKVNYIDGQIFGENRAPTWPFSFETYWRIHRPMMSFVAEEAGEVVGFVVGNIEHEEHGESVLGLVHSADQPTGHDRVGWIDMIGIRPDHQRKGIGEKLVEAFVEACRHNGAIVRGMAREDDEGLKKFLASLGFKKSEFTVYEKR